MWEMPPCPLCGYICCCGNALRPELNKNKKTLSKLIELINDVVITSKHISEKDLSKLFEDLQKSTNKILEESHLC